MDIMSEGELMMIGLPVQDSQGRLIGRLMLEDDYMSLMRKEVLILGGVYSKPEGKFMGYTLSPLPATKRPRKFLPVRFGENGQPLPDETYYIEVKDGT